MKKLLFLLPACAAVPTSTATSALEVSSSCYDPESYGAVANDGLDDRPAIQSAIDAAGAAGGGTVCLGAGKWRLTRAPLTAADRFAGLSIAQPHVHLRGAGQGLTVLYVDGDQGAGALYVVAVDHTADSTISDLTIDTSLAYNTDEQTHAVHVLGPQDGTTIERVAFNHPHPTDGSRGGDCIQLVGNGADLVRNTTVRGNTFAACARSGVMVQRGVVGLAVTGSTFTAGIHDTPIDSEPTSTGLDADVMIAGNLFAGTPGSFGVTLGGYDQPMTGIVVTGNVFSGQGLWTYRVKNLTVTGNVIHAPTGRVFQAQNTAQNVLLSGNVITEDAGATPPDYVVYFSHHGTEAGGPDRITVTGNVVNNDAGGAGILISGGSHITVADNDVQSSVYGVFITPMAWDIDDVMIRGNRFGVVGGTGARVGRYSPAYPFHTGRITVFGNVSTGTTKGLWLPDPAEAYTGAVVSAANNWAGIAVTAPMVPSPGN